MRQETKSYRVAVISGDGIGKEVMRAAIDSLEKVAALDGFGLNFQAFDWSSQKYLQTGEYIPEGGLEELKSFDAILFGAVGSQGS